MKLNNKQIYIKKKTNAIENPLMQTITTDQINKYIKLVI